MQGRRRNRNRYNERDQKYRRQKGRSSWKPVRLSLEELEAEVEATIRNRLSENTEKGAYSTGWDAWCEFNDRYAMDTNLANEDKLLAWGAWLKLRREVGGPSMRTYAYGVQSELKARGTYLGLTAKEAPRWKAFRDGRKVEKPPAPPKIAITTGILKIWFANMDRLPWSEWDKLVWRTFILVSQQTMRRNDEMVRKDLGGLAYGMFGFESGDGRCGTPTRGDSEQWAALHFDKSKCNQTGAPQIATLTCRCRTGLCALHSLIDLFRWSLDTDPENKIFRLSDGTVITYKMTYDWIKDRATEAEMDRTRFATHRLRAGGAIDQIDEAANLSPATYQKAKRRIMRNAHWKSDITFYHYTGNRDAMAELRRALGYHNITPSAALSDPRRFRALSKAMRHKRRTLHRAKRRKYR